MKASEARALSDSNGQSDVEFRYVLNRIKAKAESGCYSFEEYNLSDYCISKLKGLGYVVNDESKPFYTISW